MSVKGVGVWLVFERQGGERVSFDRLPVRVGRRGYNDLTVRDPRVSSEHCVINVSDVSAAPPFKAEGEGVERHLTVRDLNSRNGTMLKRGARELLISPHHPVPLQRGDVLWLGDRHDPVSLTLIELSFESPSDPSYDHRLAPQETPQDTPQETPQDPPQDTPHDHHGALEAQISELAPLDEPRALLKRVLAQPHLLSAHSEALINYLGDRLTSAAHHEALRSAAEELVENHERLKRSFETQRALLEQDREQYQERVELDEPSRAQLLSLPLEQLITLDLPLKPLIATFEERVIRARLARCDDNRTHAAQSLELSRQALQNKLAKWRDLADEPEA